MKAKNTQEYCDYFNARRAMESTHKVWMDTPLDNPDFRHVVKAKDDALEAYRVAYSNYTGHGVI